MSIETFDPTECFNGRKRSTQGRLVKHDDAGAMLELIHGESGKAFSRTTGGQLVTRPGEEVSSDDR